MAGTIDTVLEIDTPEHLAFRTRIAGPGRRMLAWIIDLLVRGMVLMVGGTILGTMAATGLDGLSTGLQFFLVFLIDWFYFTIFELMTGGRSPGKMALKLRVVRPNGLPITWRESVLRNFVRAADIAIIPAAPYFLTLGPIVMALDSKFRRLGDLVADTIVVVEANTGVAQETAVRPDAAIVAELPGTLPLDRTDLEALELFVNRDHMTAARRAELAQIVAKDYAERLNVDPPRDPVAFLGSLWAKAQDPGRRTGT